jgi:hypothetical protein
VRAIQSRAIRTQGGSSAAIADLDQVRRSSKDLYNHGVIAPCERQGDAASPARQIHCLLCLERLSETVSEGSPHNDPEANFEEDENRNCDKHE